MKKQSSGFTLIELMIVVAIVGILAAIAIPAYQDYMVRSKISECAASLGACKTSVAEFYGTKSRFPGTASAGCGTDNSQYCAAPTTTGGVITVGVQTTTGTPAGCSLVLTAEQATSNAITAWQGSNVGCTSSHIPANFR